MKVAVQFLETSDRKLRKRTDRHERFVDVMSQEAVRVDRASKQRSKNSIPDKTFGWKLPRLHP